MPYDFLQVDAFSRHPLCGNPAVVVLDADAMPAATMQQVAQEMNVSETVFLLSPRSAEADYRVRIFTPRSELPFAGHPTIAAAHAMRERHPELRGRPLLRQECGIGIVPVEAIPQGEGTLLRMTQAPPIWLDAPLPRETVAAMLGCKATQLADSPFQVVSTGVPWLVAELASFPTISELEPDLALIERECRALRAAGITVFVACGGAQAASFRLRTFAPGEGIAEDPVCGSGNGAVAAYLARHRYPDRDSFQYWAEQGIEIERDGEVHASWERSGDRLAIRIGGEAVTVASGQLLLQGGGGPSEGAG